MCCRPEACEPYDRERAARCAAAHRARGTRLYERERDCFALGSPPRLRFVSPIADGADQIAAEVALELGWELQAVLPFERADYRASLANHGARERFDALLERASCVLELPGDRTRELEAYVMTGPRRRSRIATY